MPLDRPDPCTSMHQFTPINIGLQADPDTCTYGCGAAVWAGLAFGSEMTRYLCSVNASAEAGVCSEPYYNQVGKRDAQV